MSHEFDSLRKQVFCNSFNLSYARRNYGFVSTDRLSLCKSCAKVEFSTLVEAVDEHKLVKSVEKYVPGTTATDATGAIAGIGDPYAQTAQILRNIEAARS